MEYKILYVHYITVSRVGLDKKNEKLYFLALADLTGEGIEEQVI